MRCMRCGEEIQAGAAFCPRCLEEMEKFPVKPGTPVILPPPPKPVQKTATRSKRPEEEIRALRRWVKLLLAAVAVLLAALTVVTFLLVKSRMKGMETVPIGKNYSTTEETKTPGKGSVAG